VVHGLFIGPSSNHPSLRVSRGRRLTLYAIALFGSGAFRLLGGSHEIPNFIPCATKGQRIKA